MTGRPEVAIKHYAFLIIHLPFVIIMHALTHAANHCVNGGFVQQQLFKMRQL